MLSLATPQAALDALDTRPTLTVYIAGIVTEVVDYSGDHGVGVSAVGRLRLLLPLPNHVVPGASVEVQAGHNDLVGTIFSGYIPSEAAGLSMRGATVDMPIRGWSKLMDEDNWEDLSFEGPLPLETLFVTLAERMQVPSYIADTAVYVDGVTPVMLGGNSRIDEGLVTVKSQQSPLSQGRRMADDYGYKIHDLPSGAVAQALVAGLPNTEPVIVLREGVHLASVGRDTDHDTIVNYWDVQGQEYEDDFGAKVPIRSRPATVPYDPRIKPDGVRRKGHKSSDIVRQDQADAIRQRLEIDTSEPETIVSWSGIGLPGIAPGDVVEIHAPTVGVSGRYWLMTMKQVFSVREGFAGSFTAWAGAGTALPSLVERTEIVIDDGVWHLGDEYVAWYRNPSPQGIRKSWPFTLPTKATHVNIRAYGHSWNSQLSAGQNKDLNTSKWEIHQAGADRNAEGYRPVDSGSLPVMAENYLQRPNFSRFVTDPVTGDVTDPGKWAPTAVSLSRLDPGDYVLDFVCGKGAGYDDGEVRRIRLEVFGANEPAPVVGGQQ